VLLGACAQPATSSSRAPAEPIAPADGGSQAGAAAAEAAQWQAEWERTLAAARQEETVVLGLQVGQSWRDWVAQFEKAYPGIRVEIAGPSGGQLVSRVVAERRAGQFLWDVHIGGAESINSALKPEGGLLPLRPALMLPEVLDDSKWLGGFDDGFTDREGTYIYSFRGEVGHTVAVNRDLVPEAQLGRIEDLVDPRWKGKMSLYDPRNGGKGAADGGHFIMARGEDWWRQLLAQEPVITLDRRQQIEWVVRGQYPIAISADTVTQHDFRRQGLGLNVKPLAPETDMGSKIAMSSTVALFERPPHPHAARVFANWVLSREGQDAFSRTTGQNSRRLDVEGPPETTPDPNRTYLPSVNKDQYVRFQARAEEIAKEMLK
jgi:ABC-type Fe3+ transport system substrate-binding protein